MLGIRRKFLEILKKIKLIQGYFKSIYLYKKFKKIIASAKVINRNVRMFLGKIRAKKRRYVLTRIQSYYRMRLQVRKFIVLREQNVQY